jgi:hypothetical protein
MNLSDRRGESETVEVSLRIGGKVFITVTDYGPIGKSVSDAQETAREVLDNFSENG